MRSNQMYKFICITVIVYLTAQSVLAQTVPPTIFGVSDSVVTVILAADGQQHSVGSGLVVRSDGYIMTANSLVKGARNVQIRLANGEVYDNAQIISTDERRNVALLRINATGLKIIPNGTVEETQVGSPIHILANPTGKAEIGTAMLKSVQMLDDNSEGGTVYRVLQFDLPAGGSTAGGLILDNVGRSLGMITTTPGMRSNIAVPFSSILGMIRSVQPMSTTASTMSSAPGPTNSPYPIPQGSVVMPERGVTQLQPKGPGSVTVKPATVPEILATAKTIYVSSRTVSFKPEQMINALNKRKEIAEWGLTFTTDSQLADLVLELDHVVLTWKYTFKIYSQRLGTVVATGSNIILDGNVGADDMANRVIDKLKAAGAAARKPRSPSGP
jgi:hypothetical protein